MLTLRSVFEEAFLSFLHEDQKLILTDAHEQSLCARLAMSLERAASKHGLVGYRADAEYNRNYGEVKTIIDDQHREINITCDIILHSRGENRDADNLIAIEMKKAKAKDVRKNSDRDRLRALTKPCHEVYSLASADRNYVCGYELGYFIDMNRHEGCALIEVYAAGDLQESYVQRLSGEISERKKA